MQRPSGQGLPILFERPSYEWVARVNRKHKRLDELRPSAVENETLDRWIEKEFVYSTLHLEGSNIQLEQVEQLASPKRPTNDSALDKSASALIESLRLITSI